MLELEESPTFQEIRDGGKLWWEVGLENRMSQLTAIMEHLVASVNCVQTLQPTALPKFSCILTATAISPVNLDKIMDIGQYTSRNQQGKESPVPWMKWLLTAGDVVSDLRNWEVGFPDEHPNVDFSKGRTGGALMFKLEGSPGWKVSTGHSGTITNNFLTRALAGREIEFDNFIIPQIMGAIS
jgi:hypothetical protein